VGVKEEVESACERELINGAKRPAITMSRLEDCRRIINKAQNADDWSPASQNFEYLKMKKGGKIIITEISNSVICSEADLDLLHKYLITFPVPESAHSHTRLEATAISGTQGK
jgi:hypothetical protein